MISPDDLPAIEAGLLSRRGLPQLEAVLALDKVASPQEDMLVRVSSTLREKSWMRPFVISAFGRVPSALHTAEGDEFVRAAFHATGPGSDDLVSSASGALAARRGRSASDEFDRQLRAPGSTVRKYAAVVALAHVGDDRAWEPVFERFVRQLKKAPRVDPPELIAQVIYLMRHADPSAHPDRGPRVARALVAAREHLETDPMLAKGRDLLRELWPSVLDHELDQVAFPATAVFEAWARVTGAT
jgi:hypothetical protein